MASRRNIPPSYDERYIQASGMVHSGPPSHRPREPLPLPVYLENKLASQAAEIEELARDNHKLSSSHLALRQDLVAAQRETDQLREHIRSIHAEGDIQIRILLEKIAKMEAEIMAGDNIKKELQEAHIEARSLVTSKQELTAKIQQATKELENLRADVKKVPEMHAELDSLKQEHQRLRKTFEYEKGMNVEKVEQMKIFEKELIAMAGEVERLRSEVLNAENRANAPTPYMNSDNFYPPAVHGNGGYVDGFGRPHLHAVEGMDAYGSRAFPVGPPAGSGGAAGGVGGGAAWGGVYDMPHAWR